jgi:hypothetical protein
MCDLFVVVTHTHAHTHTHTYAQMISLLYHFEVNYHFPELYVRKTSDCLSPRVINITFYNIGICCRSLCTSNSFIQYLH